VSEIRSFWRNVMTFDAEVAEMASALRGFSYVSSGGKNLRCARFSSLSMRENFKK